MLIILLFIFLLIGWISADSREKTQYVRLLDIFLYGPIMVYISLDNSNNLRFLFRICLLIIGGTTITYNAKNYIYN